ncbi:MAG: hypothetical protein F6K35_14640 [Okeania sp. SIO2H7]|nr:hypothetical protein [Okeania sp. SIO2H7]
MNRKRFDAKNRKEKGKRITEAKAEEISPEQQPPMFSLRYLNRDYNLSQCTKDEKAAFADKIAQLSQLTWSQIQSQPRHGLGYEKIDKNVIRSSIPNHITNDVNLIAFRFCGKAPMVGYRDRAVFYIIWLDRDFTLYSH